MLPSIQSLPPSFCQCSGAICGNYFVSRSSPRRSGCGRGVSELSCAEHLACIVLIFLLVGLSWVWDLLKRDPRVPLNGSRPPGQPSRNVHKLPLIWHVRVPRVVLWRALAWTRSSALTVSHCSACTSSYKLAVPRRVFSQCWSCHQRRSWTQACLDCRWSDWLNCSPLRQRGLRQSDAIVPWALNLVMISSGGLAAAPHGCCLDRVHLDDRCPSDAHATRTAATLERTRSLDIVGLPFRHGDSPAMLACVGPSGRLWD